MKSEAVSHAFGKKPGDQISDRANAFWTDLDENTFGFVKRASDEARTETD